MAKVAFGYIGAFEMLNYLERAQGALSVCIFLHLFSPQELKFTPINVGWVDVVFSSGLAVRYKSNSQNDSILCPPQKSF